MYFFKINQVSLVVHGRTSYESDIDGQDPYEVPKGLGIFKQIDSGNPMSTQDIMARIINNRFVEIFHLDKIVFFFLVLQVRI